ncbi:probable receptor kinase At1g33260 [Olea europaea subsp. europaea]|uniref:Probable receptor kinase At1g33260 n=1 Tax=Olea europaea subsp. europaea TaxID=158383 RepID=A0A8S0UTI9_OLEEU|nr:probable receptor kinase At1g33260 [Olea europaea subsp. europaea]
MCLASFLKFLKFKLRRKRIVDKVASIKDDNHLEGNDSIKSAARRYTWNQMQKYTMNFSSVIGYGGFSTVYLAQYPDSTTGAVKIHSQSDRLNQAFKQELEILLHLEHDNIVKLLGYCDDQDEGFLILEYAPNGNLQEKLHCVGKSTGRKTTVLPWKRRMAIAFQLALAIEYLHEKCALQIVHGDIKSSNILLDEQLNCKLCDFGSAKMGFSSTVLPQSSHGKNRMMLGSPGYTDPHYFRTGLASKKNDVYSYGVVVLELITGMEAFSAHSGERLTRKLDPMLRDAEKVVEIVDPHLRGEFVLEEAKVMTSLSAMCLSDSPSLRPSASDILRTMRNGIPSFSFLFRGKA